MVQTSIYWIRHEHHADPLQEGYIGISNNPSKRFSYHSNSKRTNKLLKEAIALGAKLVVIQTASSYKEALYIEKQMRPTRFIGWNIAVGGLITKPNTKGMSFKEKKNGLLGEARTVAQKLASEKKKGKTNKPAPNAKPIEVNGVTYPNIRTAMKELRCGFQTLYRFINGG